MKSLPGEIWEHVNGSEEDVEISTAGRVRKNGKIANRQINKDGYYIASFGRPLYRKLVHRMVALQFIPNDDPEHKTVVDHIDSNKRNNDVSNLRWLTPGDNTRAAVEAGLVTIRKKGWTVVKQIKTGQVRVFPTVTKAASAIGGDDQQLNQVIQGKRKNHKGYHAYRVEEEFDDDYYMVKIKRINKLFSKKEYRTMVVECFQNILNKSKGEINDECRDEEDWNNHIE